MVEVEISIVCLIYKSAPLAEALYKSVQKYTPKLASGQAEFFFVANDPTEEVMKFLKSKNIPHYLNMNEHLSNEELFSKGFGTPEYMRRVYEGYNLGILKAKGQKVVLINSDNFFSPDWLENLLKYSDYKKVVSSTLVEPGQERAGVFPFAIEKNFGRTLDDFQEDEFQDFAEKISKTGYTSGGAYMPCLLYKDIAVMAGLYPEGNLAGETFDTVSRFGDEYFYDRLKEFGVEHITAKDSVVYHLKEGEKSEATQDLSPHKAKLTKPTRMNERLVVHPRDLIPYITPEVKHQGIIDELGRKVTALITNPESDAEVNKYLRTIKDFDFKNIEVVLISDDKKLLQKFDKRLRAVYTTKEKTDRALYEVFHDMYGEHLLVMNKHCKYEKNLFDDVTNRNVTYYFGGEEPVDEITMDYTGHLIVSKKDLVNRIPTFLELLITQKKMRLNLSELAIIDISKPKPVELDVAAGPLTLRNAHVRLAKKIRRDGVKGLVVLAKDRVFKK